MRQVTIAMLVLPALLAGCGDMGSPTESDNGPAFFNSVSAGGGHACAIAVDGGTYCWGSDATAELGDGKSTASAVPVRVATQVSFTRISAGLHHTCALSVSGQAYCWGWNGYGQLGLGGFGNSGIAFQVGTTAFTTLASGWTHTCAGTAAGQVYCWGRGGQGELGNGSMVNQDRPVAVTGAPPLFAISAGAFHTCGLTSAGAAYCWGSNALGQLGNGTTNDTATPTPVAGGLKFSAISAGHTHTCGITAQGLAYCWGSNSSGEAGNLTLAPSPALPGSTTPVPVSQGNLQLTNISAGLNYTCAAAAIGNIYCWGRGLEGQLGTGRQIDYTSPREVLAQNPNLNLRAVSTGSAAFACALQNVGGAVYCWGTGPSGELGVANTTLSTVPVRVDAPR